MPAGPVTAVLPARIKSVVFDVGETLVDETRAWSLMADAAGVSRLTLFAALGALIESGMAQSREPPVTTRLALTKVGPPSVSVVGRHRVSRRVRRRRAAVAAVGVAIVAFIAMGLGRASARRPGRGDHGSSVPTVGSAATPPSTAGARLSLPVPGPPFQVGTITTDLPSAGTVVPTIVRYPAVRTSQGLVAASGAGPFPLIVFSGGWQVQPGYYSNLLDGWAAQGYVVAFPVYPGTAPGVPGPPEWAVVEHPAQLAGVIADLEHGGGPLAGLVDATRVGVAGHSDGGDVTEAAVNNSCCTIAAVRAAVILSGAQLASFDARGRYGTAGPATLVIQGDRDTINPPGCSQAIYDSSPEPRYYLDLLGAGHYPAYLDPAGLAAYPSQAGATEAGLYRQVVTRATIGFWNQYLRGSAATSWAATADTPRSTLTVDAPVPATGAC